MTELEQNQASIEAGQGELLVDHQGAFPRCERGLVPTRSCKGQGQAVERRGVGRIEGNCPLQRVDGRLPVFAVAQGKAELVLRLGHIGLLVGDAPIGGDGLIERSFGVQAAGRCHRFLHRIGWCEQGQRCVRQFIGGGQQR